MGRHSKNGALWFSLAISLCTHLGVLAIFEFSGWPVSDNSFHVGTLVVNIVDSPLSHELSRQISPSPSRQQADSLHSLNADAEQDLQGEPPDKKRSGRQPTQSIPGFDQASNSTEIREFALNIQQRKTEALQQPSTLNAKTLIEQSIAMIRDDPYLGDGASQDFTQYLLMKRFDEIKHLFPELLEQQQLLEGKGVEEFTTTYGDTRVTLNLGNGKKVCFEVPQIDPSASGIYVLPNVWKLPRCLPEIED